MRILFLGNSFTYVNDLPDMVKHLLKCETRHITRGGAFLHDFCNPEDELFLRLQDAWKEPWDFVVIQEQSFNAVGKREDFLRHAHLLCLQAKSIGAKPVLYSTWAYEENTPKLEGTGLSYGEMDEALAAAYAQAAAENDALLAPVGKYFTMMRDSYRLYWPDYYHPTIPATYLAACVIGRTIAPEASLANWAHPGLREVFARAFREVTRGKKRLRRQAAFRKPGEFLKGNLHSHTTRSDGRLTPEATIRQYAAAGYDFLALTDHNLYNRKNYAPETGMIILGGMELDARLPEPGIHAVHVIALGADEEQNGFAQDQTFKYGSIPFITDAQAMIDDALAARNLVVYNHPEWSGTCGDEIRQLEGFDLIEVWNTNNVFRFGLDANAPYWDELLYHGCKVYGVASDDGHCPEHNAQGCVMVKAERDASSILRALRKGAFYASCGPEIYDFYVEDGVATVLCSPASCVRFRHFMFPYVQVKGENLTCASIPVEPGTNYIRAEVVDAQGRRAWTNPIFLDDEE